jgi:antitoxin YefM
MGLALSYVIPYVGLMSKTITATDARAKLYKLLIEVNTSHSPITITGKSGNAVLVSEDDWNAVMETVALHSVPALVEDINSGRDEPIDTTPLTW